MMAFKTNQRSRSPLGLTLALLTLPFCAQTAAADTGGMTFEQPAVTAITCGDSVQRACPRGQLLRVSGTALGETKLVRFLGAEGKRDDRVAHPLKRKDSLVVVRVPLAARTGKLRLVAGRSAVVTPKLTVLPKAPLESPLGTQTVSDSAVGVFPIAGKHKFGTGAAAFGGGRGHQGQDVFAKCGTPLVAAESGTVYINKFEGRAGNYLVINAEDGTSQAYMHMKDRSSLQKGDVVAAGDPIGEVGQTGHASGCHLHFEQWTAPGWYQGGSPTNPLPTLKRWDQDPSALAAAHR